MPGGGGNFSRATSRGMALTAKQQRFVQEFLLDLNATQAAIRAGYSAKTAQEQGSQMLAHPDIRAAIDAAKLKRSERTEIDADWMLRRLVQEAEADFADLYDDSGDLKPIESWPLIWRQGLVAGVEVEALYEGSGENRIQVGQVKKIRLSDRVRRLEMIGKHVRVNAFRENVNHTGLDALGDRLERALRARAAAPVVIDAQSRPSVPERASVALPASPKPIAAPAVAKPPAVPAAPAAPADWERPSERPTAPAYQPVLPWPERQGFADCDYDNQADGLISARRNT